MPGSSVVPALSPPDTPQRSTSDLEQKNYQTKIEICHPSVRSLHLILPNFEL
jgi:hypothetical protein